MRKEDLIKQAAKRLATALELLHRAAAVQTVAHRQSVGTEQAAREIVKIMEAYFTETDQVADLIDKFLITANGNSEAQKVNSGV